MTDVTMPIVLRLITTFD